MRYSCPKCDYRTNVESKSVQHAINLHGAIYSEKYLGQVRYRSKVRKARSASVYSNKIAPQQ